MSWPAPFTITKETTLTIRTNDQHNLDTLGENTELNATNDERLRTLLTNLTRTIKPDSNYLQNRVAENGFRVGV